MISRAERCPSPTGGGRSIAGCSAVGALMVLGLVMAWPAARRSRSGWICRPSISSTGRRCFWSRRALLMFACPSCRRAMCGARRCSSSRSAWRWSLLALLFGHEVKGARRWIFGIQPSEFVKPGLRHPRRLGVLGRRAAARRAGHMLALLLLPLTIVPLILQPDFGQTMLVSMVWASLFFMAGLHWFWVARTGRRPARSAGCCAFKIRAACARAHPALHRSRFRAAAWSTRSRSTPRCKASCPAAGSARARAKGAQAHPARRAYRFHFRGDGRGVRHRRLPGRWSPSSPSS